MWVSREANTICDTDAGEVYRDQSPGKVASLEACQQFCEADADCQSITYFNNGWCSHFSTACSEITFRNKATAFQWVITGGGILCSCTTNHVYE